MKALEIFFCFMVEGCLLILVVLPMASLKLTKTCRPKTYQGNYDETIGLPVKTEADREPENFYSKFINPFFLYLTIKQFWVRDAIYSELTKI